MFTIEEKEKQNFKFPPNPYVIINAQEKSTGQKLVKI